MSGRTDRLAQDIRGAAEILSLATALVPQVALAAEAVAGLIGVFRRGEATPDQQVALADALAELLKARDLVQANHETYMALPRREG
jgi:hypothetical protein